MSEKNESSKNINVSVGLGWVFLTVMVVLFWGEPDIHDALIVGLSDGAYQPSR